MNDGLISWVGLRLCRRISKTEIEISTLGAGLAKDEINFANSTHTDWAKFDFSFC